MTTPTPPKTDMSDIYQLLVGFGLPVILLLILSGLMIAGIDGEVKTLMAAVVGWIIKSGVTYKRK
jgi:hypothetical protein